jgi:hypothetical protein
VDKITVQFTVAGPLDVIRDATARVLADLRDQDVRVTCAELVYGSLANLQREDVQPLEPVTRTPADPATPADRISGRTDERIAENTENTGGARTAAKTGTETPRKLRERPTTTRKAK